MCFFLPAVGAAAAGASAGIGTALSLVSTVAGFGIQIAQASAAQSAAMAEYNNQVEYRRRQEEQAQKTLNLQVAQQQAALESEKGKAQGEKADIAIEGYAAKSRASAAAAESGIVGLSVANLMGDIEGRIARAEGKIDYNAKVGFYNAKNELKMAQRGHGARLAEIPIPVKPRFNMGLEIAAAGVSALSSIGSTLSRQPSITPGYTDNSGRYLG